MYIFSATTLVSKLTFLVLLVTLASCSVAKKQALNDEEKAYRTMIDGRTYKIVAPLGIADSAQFYKVRDIVSLQYRNLRDIHATRDMQQKQAKEKFAADKEALKAASEKIEAATNAKLKKLHQSYLTSLAKKINAQQIEQIKDGMTYSVLPKTYQAHLDMIPSLKEDEKKYIYDALYEAREFAMDAETSDKKHAWFGKYKGRINNYLSARGYDLIKEREGWYERIKQAKSK